MSLKATPHTDTPPEDSVFSTLLPELQKAVAKKGYHTPTPIQQKAIPALLEGRDMLGSAQTGTGKTAAFVLPILQRLILKRQPLLPGKPQVLILAPTRELAAQIGDSVATYGRHCRISKTVIFGGVKQTPQVECLKRGKHIVIATPGRLLDLLQQRHISLSAVDVVVLDEADRMLDMGFLPDIKKIISHLPAQRQTLFFSATLAYEVKKLAKTLVHNPVEITISPEKLAVEEIDQKVFFIDQRNKISLLVALLRDTTLNKVIVFVRMKYEADRVVEHLTTAGIQSNAIHGDKSQQMRTRSLNNFKTGHVRVLVATDIAARGIDVDRISHVINYDLPLEAETYVHRIGRTARAGTKGDAVSFCSSRERAALNEIEHLLHRKIPRELDHNYHSDQAQSASGADARPKPRVPYVRASKKMTLAKLITPSPSSKGAPPRRKKLRHKK